MIDIFSMITGGVGGAIVVKGIDFLLERRGKRASAIKTEKEISNMDAEELRKSLVFLEVRLDTLQERYEDLDENYGRAIGMIEDLRRDKSNLIEEKENIRREKDNISVQLTLLKTMQDNKS